MAENTSEEWEGEFDVETRRERTLSRKYQWDGRVLSEGAFVAGVADMDFEVATCITDAVAERLRHRVFGYENLPPTLLPGFVAWLARRHGWVVEESHVLLSPNVISALVAAMAVLTAVGDGVIVQPPTYTRFFHLVQENGRRLLHSPLLLRNGRYEFDFDGLESVAADPTAKVLLLCNPANPVGRVWSPAELRRLGDICVEHGVTVISDEIHADLVLPGHTFTPYLSLGEPYASQAIAALSPAKTFNIESCSFAFVVAPNAGWREDMAAGMSRTFTNRNPNAFASVAVDAAFREGGAWVDRVMKYLERNVALVRTYLTEHITTVKLVEPEGTFLLWLDFRAVPIAPAELGEFLQTRAQWYAILGELYGEEGAGFLRVNVACPRSRIRRALDNLRKALDSLA
eukprot:CAMPEP_0119128842 /NCGR_PEP_ID=MMETSP1310-20130426/6833_1 /TAXON_ID=464262 /ORGANISM="Genus nov. species nov., Strain RCC2339" /LENGTH=400 /DNA_ID=CAMNT_0007119215 /DNA_START=9 /DNA_END=1211 /DNA_ORIENTATION=-